VGLNGGGTPENVDRANEQRITADEILPVDRVDGTQASNVGGRGGGGGPSCEARVVLRGRRR